MVYMNPKVTELLRGDSMVILGHVIGLPFWVKWIAKTGEAT